MDRIDLSLLRLPVLVSFAVVEAGASSARLVRDAAGRVLAWHHSRDWAT